MPLLELRELTCERDERQLFANLSATLGVGQLLQVVGPNGAGKTSLLRIVTGMSQDYEGAICWQGRPLAAQRQSYSANLLYLGHNPGVKKALSPRENLTFYQSLGAGYGSGIDAMLAQVGLAEFADVPCYQLSAGQQRRVALARLFGDTAPLWVLDEPFTALDKRGVQTLEERFAAHLQSGGSIIVTSHQALSLPNIVQLDLAQYAGVAA